MSRGAGRIQRAILALIEAEPDGAWSTPRLCAVVYPDVHFPTKKHRVAVNRALRQMQLQLPQPWRVGRLAKCCMLYNGVSERSIARRYYISTIWGPSWGRNFEEWFQHVVEDKSIKWPTAWREEAAQNRAEIGA
jgi:hypothetical protein